MYYEDINKHMNAKFTSYDNMKELKRLPSDAELNKMQDNVIYKVKYICLFIDMVNYTQIDKHTDPKIMNAIMSEYVYGVTKIMKMFNEISIDLQGDGIFCILNANTTEEVANSFSLASSLNTFVEHMNVQIEKYFGSDFKDGSYYTPDFECGIGLWLSWNNYVSKVGHGSSRDIIYMGESVKYASELSKSAARDNYSNILLNESVYMNIPNEDQSLCSKVNHIIRSQNIYSSNAVIINYNNYIKNNL